MSSGLGVGISRVNGTRNVSSNDISILNPLLNGEPLNINVTCMRSEAFFVNHVESSYVVDQHASRTRAKEGEFLINTAKVLDSLGTQDSSIELSLSRRGSNACRKNATVDNTGASVLNNPTKKRLPCIRAGGKGHINSSKKFLKSIGGKRV